MLDARARSVLDDLRVRRGFDAGEVAAAKLGRLRRWFSAQRLDAAVVGVSGGVDSALVLALLRALETEGALRRVVALLLPIASRGATRQAEATSSGRLVAEALGAEAWVAPLAEAHRATVEALARASGLAFDAWAEGQALSVARTPALYGAAALLQAHGFRSVVVGTTNRDEGAYLGFFGKASDGMVDLQPVSDLHKSEVRALARHLGVPEEIVSAVPSGDVHDGRVDEEMIGASYDEVELFLGLRRLGRAPFALPEAARAAIARQHEVNRHKYAVGSPAVHLDVLARGVPGGWADEVISGRDERRPPAGVLPGEWTPGPVALDAFHERWPARDAVPLGGLEGFAVVGRSVLTRADCTRLRDAMRASGQAEPVGVTGVRDGYGTGSLRATAWSPELARALWERLAPIVPSARFAGAHAPTEAFATAARAAHRSWRAVGLSPVLRFMRYEPGGRHFGHHDAGFDYGDGRRSLLSVVFYLTDAPESGATRFVRDGQEHLPTHERVFVDFDRETREDEVIARVPPRAGDVLVFDHRLCHDVEEWRGPGERVIVRADVVYEAVPDGRTP